MAKRISTIGTNPLDALLSESSRGKEKRKGSEQEKQERSSRSERETTGTRLGGTKQRFTVHLSTDVIERARNAVFWTPGLTLAGLAEEALLRELEKLEGERGDLFPQRTEELKGGRPVR